MKFFKVILLMGLLSNLFSCNKIKNKIEKIENNVNPGSPYKEAGIDHFYWEAEDKDKYIIPLIKPLRLIKWKANDDWGLETSTIGWKYGDLSPIVTIKVKDVYIYGLKDIDYFGDDRNIVDSPAFFYLINTKTKEIKTYDYEREKNKFEEELKRLELPEKYLEPHNIYMEYEKYPDLEWFPEDIKTQLNEVKASLK